MKPFSKVVFLAFVISITGCGGNNSVQNNATPNTQGQTAKRPVVQQKEGTGNSYRVLSTDLDNTYYRNAMGKSGAELKRALHDIISEQTALALQEP
ncbi:hypothetical protein P4I20_20805, partial [Paenibacillus graminis]|uniref:hypothetical protein n=1 Tax=Paenibacillus graminis TaxID=189425 RepID=UPI002DB76E51|nr:hypothetical protein [Paenibacillus graminis]MEC0170971.1 hypothetical protein [Paenibacillus graminis]